MKGGESRWREYAVPAVIAFVLVFLVNLDRVTQVPVWDTATGLFPAALTLAENGFDVFELVELPGWVAGGPNANPFSLLTWLTAIVLFFIDGTTAAFVVLHCLHYGFVAATLTAVFLLGRRLFGRFVAFCLCVATLLFPLFFVQTGYMYFEVPLCAATVLAVAAMGRRDHRLAVIAASVAVLIKSAGLIVVGGVGVALLLAPMPWRRRVRLLLALSVAPVFHISTLMIQGSSSQMIAWTGPAAEDATTTLLSVLVRLAMVPDLAVLLAAVFISSVVLAPRIVRSLRFCDDPPMPPEIAAALLIIFGFCVFYLLIPFTGILFWMLPRYCTQVVPLIFIITVFAIAGTERGLRERLKGLSAPEKPYYPLTSMFLVGLMAFFIVNREGHFYPPFKGGAFSLVERDMAYRGLLELQQGIAKSTAELPADVPKYYPRPMHYFLTYPRLGYVDDPVVGGHFILTTDPEGRGAIGDFPDHFFLIVSNLAHGGEVLVSVWQQAEFSPEYQTRALGLSHRGFPSFIVEVKRVASNDG